MKDQYLKQAKALSIISSQRTNDATAAHLPENVFVRPYRTWEYIHSIQRDRQVHGQSMLLGLDFASSV
jgi:hypothetical protein